MNRSLRAVRTGGIVVSSRTAESTRSTHAELVARLARGEREEPLSLLYDAYGRQIYGLGVHLLRDAGLAEDLVQETFVRLWRSAPRYDHERSSVRTFVFTLARRAAVDLWRRRGVGVAPHELDEPGDDDVAGSDAYEQLLLRLAVGEALEELTPAHREIVVLQYREDRTQAQVARRLGIPLGTVKSRTAHAMRALSAQLEERGLA